MCVHPEGRKLFADTMNPEGGGRSRPPGESPPAGCSRTRGVSRGREQKKIGLWWFGPIFLCRGALPELPVDLERARRGREKRETRYAGGWGESLSGSVPPDQTQRRAARPDEFGARLPRARPEGPRRSPSTHPGGVMAGRGARMGARTRDIVHGPLARGRAGSSPPGPKPTLPTQSERRPRRRARWNRPGRSPDCRTSNVGALRPYSAQPSALSDGGPANGLEPRNFVARRGD